MAPKRKAPGESSEPQASVSAPMAQRSAVASEKGLDLSADPMSSIPLMFEDMVTKALTGSSLLEGQPLALTVATVCSGTEAPLTALSLTKEAILNVFGQDLLQYRHKFSCEVEPYKQAFIRRNHDPPVIFRNVVELGADGAQAAMDASGCLKDIPTERLDMLIAGTSCVDYSTLNNKKDGKTKLSAFSRFSTSTLTGEDVSEVKLDPEFRSAVHEQLSPDGLQGLGESMATFLSTLNFIMDRRPRIVILENVSTAPWKSMEGFWLPRAGYAARHTKVDSKDFYVPQDRIRGYLVALDAEEFGKCGLDVSKLLSEIIESISKLKRRASSSVQDFLLDDDDPNLLQAREEIASHGAYGAHGAQKDIGPRQHGDWDYSRLRHEIYSQRWNLDTIRRFSKANLSHGRVVAISPPARSWAEYWARESPRVIDLFDNLYQQLLMQAGCDMRYKTAVFNVSQNLDRIAIGITKFGIAPVLTPAGMPTLTNLGRPLLGVECLTLQGIPRNHLRLAGETHRELRDLAGNAMTATVVGAVILATLMAVGPNLAKIHSVAPQFQPSASPSVAEPLDHELEEPFDWGFGEFNIDPSSLLKKGEFRVCYCPLVGSHNRTTLRCRDCGQLACELCKGNPPHNFEPYMGANQKINIADLKVHIRQGLPGVFNMSMLGNGLAFIETMTERGVGSSFCRAVKEVVVGNDYYLAGINISTSITVEYVSQNSIARLVLTKVGDADWFILPRSSLGAQGRPRPIAKGSCIDQASTVDPESAVWSVWEPVPHSWLATVAAKGDDYFIIDHKTIKTHRRENTPAPPPHLVDHIVTMVHGTWNAKPRCGTAEDSLYVRSDHPSGRNAFLFKDVDPVGHPRNDQFIMCMDVELADTREYRHDEVKVELLQINDMGEKVQLSVPGYWQPIAPGAPFKTSVHKPKPGDSLKRASATAFVGSVDKFCCTTTPLTLLKLSVKLARLPLTSSMKERWTNKWYSIPAIELDEFFNSVSFTTNALEKGHFFKPDGRDLSFDPDRGVPVELCLECCVEPPQVHWVRGASTVVPWEDPDEVEPYESKVRRQPSPLVAMVRLDRGQDLLVQLAVNPRTLASRAAAHLTYGDRPRGYSPAILGRVQCSYQVEVGGLLGPNIRFDRFYDSIPNTTDNTGLGEVEPDGVLRLDSFRDGGYQLRKDQSRSVKWMLAREKSPAPYMEVECEEQVFEAFNLRIVGRATFPNDGSAFCCRGGIVAHEIGYGKTVVMIALLELRRLFDRVESMDKRREAALHLWGSASSFMHLKATLVIVPDHITTQWLNEFTKFGSQANIVTIKRYADLVSKPLAVLEEADVILVAASIFKSPAYKANLNSLTVDRTGGGSSDREVHDRYRSSCRTIRALTDFYLLHHGLSEKDKESLTMEKAAELVNELNENHQTLSEKRVWVGGRKEANKRRQQNKQPEETRQDKGKEPDKAKPLWSATTFLENFSFARIILDEFSYDNPGVTLFLTDSLANAKWLLSGTPRCGDLADIVHFGRLLSIHVARPDPCVPTYLNPITFGPHLKPTAPSEEYRLRSSHLRSHNFAMDRHQSAEMFVKHFIRQDQTDVEKFDVEYKKIDLDLPPLSRVAYGGLQHDLSLAKGDIFNLPFSLRRSLGILSKYSYAGDSRLTGTKAADLLMARLAALPITASTLKCLLSGSDLNVLALKEEMKTAFDKLVWLCHRARMVSQENRDKFARHHHVYSLIEDIFTGMADARDSRNRWPMAPYGGKDAYLQLVRALCPSTAFRYQEGGVEDWVKWRYIDAKTFWLDWYDMPDSYIDGLASPENREELVELSTDAILLSISHPVGRSIPRTGDDRWLEYHAKALGCIMDERTNVNFLDRRQAPATEQARAAAVRDTVPKFSSEQLVSFLKNCMAQKLVSFDPGNETPAKLAERAGKQALQLQCLQRNLRYADNNTALALAEKLFDFVQGKCVNKDFIDKRAMISPRTDFPVPNQTFERRGGNTEAILEELTATYQYFKNCREAWIDAYRRLRLYNFLRFAQYCQQEGTVDKNCGACLRQPVCSGNHPGYIMLACGHWLCQFHKDQVIERGHQAFCPTIGCGAPCGLSHPTTIRLVERDVLDCPDVWKPEGEARCSEGGKLPTIVSLIKETPTDDKVILFTYIDDLAVSVRDKLREDGISVMSMVSTDHDEALDNILEDFKNGNAKVIIIDPCAEHAAGSNLTVANHIIFAGPLLERDAFRRQMYYKQAVGRCIREGQTKKVTVTTLVTKGTIDEELYDS